MFQQKACGMKVPTNKDRTQTSRAPLPPEPEAIEDQYGEDAKLYAKIRAETAAASGREKDAKKWVEVTAEIERGDERKVAD